MRLDGIEIFVMDILMHIENRNYPYRRDICKKIEIYPSKDKPPFLYSKD